MPIAELSPEDQLELREQRIKARATSNDFYRIDLPEGDVPGFNIDWHNSDGGVPTYNPNQWLNLGKRGVEFVGRGRTKTHMRCTHWDGVTMAASKHPGITVVRDMTIHAGYEKVAHFGTGGWAIIPAFGLVVKDCDILVEDGPKDGRPRWGIFTYGANVWLDGVTIDGAELGEHNLYAHGTAGEGILVTNSELKSSGAEGLKLRSARMYNGTHEETGWAGPDVAFIVDNCTIRDWYQPHSWRGGAGIVIQGGACNVLVRRSKFYPGEGHAKQDAAGRSYCVAVSSEGDSYDIDTGQVGVGHGNGHVRIQECAMASSGKGNDWYGNKIIRVGQNGGSQWAAKSVHVQGSAVYGERMQVQIDKVPVWSIENCNGESMHELLRDRLGMPIEYDANGNPHQAVYFDGGMKNLSVDGTGSAT